MCRPVLLILPLLGCFVVLQGCSKPKLPDHDDRPEPQASLAEVAPKSAARQAVSRLASELLGVSHAPKRRRLRVRT